MCLSEVLSLSELMCVSELMYMSELICLSEPMCVSEVMCVSELLCASELMYVSERGCSTPLQIVWCKWNSRSRWNCRSFLWYYSCRDHRTCQDTGLVDIILVLVGLVELAGGILGSIGRSDQFLCFTINDI